MLVGPRKKSPASVSLIMVWGSSKTTDKFECQSTVRLYFLPSSHPGKSPDPGEGMSRGWLREWQSVSYTSACHRHSRIILEHTQGDRDSGREPQYWKEQMDWKEIFSVMTFVDQRPRARQVTCAWAEAWGRVTVRACLTLLFWMPWYHMWPLLPAYQNLDTASGKGLNEI